MPAVELSISLRRALAVAALLLVLTFMWVVLRTPAANPTPTGTTSGAMGATHADPNAATGVDLVCSNHVECGPGNPATKPAPSAVIGPKTQP
jgi:hypothetical protein